MYYDGFKAVGKTEMFELGSVFIIWQDFRNGNWDIFCQKITYDVDAIPPSNPPGDDGNDNGNNGIPSEIVFGYYVLLIFLICINIVLLGFVIRKKLRYRRYLKYSV